MLHVKNCRNLLEFQGSKVEMMARTLEKPCCAEGRGNPATLCTSGLNGFQGPRIFVNYCSVEEIENRMSQTTYSRRILSFPETQQKLVGS